MIFRVWSFLIVSLLISINGYAGHNGVFVDGPLSAADIMVTPSSCSKKGSLVIPDPKPSAYIFSWRTAADVELSKTQSATDLDPGEYKLIYSPDAGANFYSLTFTVGDSKPTVATQTLTLPCGESALMVHADNFSGKPISRYIWEDEKGNFFSDQETVALRPGKYDLSVQDNSGCRSEKALITVLPTPLRPVIYEANKVVTYSSCTANDGSITGFEVALPLPGPVSYSWVNAKGELVGNTLDVYNLAQGKYKLTAVQAGAACESISSEITILLRNPITYNTGTSVTKTTDCALPNGSITGVITNATSYQWLNVNKQVVANTLDLINVPEGFYELVLFNDFGCSETIGPFHIKAGNSPILQASPPVIKPDNCGLNVGSITGITVSGSGIRYSWTNNAGQQLSTSADLRNIGSGDYYLQINNPACSQTYHYYVPEIDLLLPTPSIGDKFICSPTDILINFDVEAPSYRIYNASGELVQESSSKDFMLNIKENSIFYAAVANGNCEGSRTAFKVTIGEASIKIPSSFTPNGDGTNDKWIIKGLEVYNAPYIKIFNRYGSVVYESFDNSTVFEGRSKGNELPEGVYYYIIRLTNDCNPFTGSVTIIR